MHSGGGEEGVENGYGERPGSQRSQLTGKKEIIHFVHIGTELQPIYCQYFSRTPRDAKQLMGQYFQYY